MASPFSIFRKHSRVLMVVLTGLAMFAFIILDQIQNVPELALPILGIMVATGGFWWVGRQHNQGLQYAVGGALLGVVLFFGILPLMTRPAAAVELNVGNLSSQQLEQLGRRRQVANEFLQAASGKLQQKYLKENAHRQAEIRDFELPRVEPSHFFGFGRPGVDDIVLGYLLNLEADKMGITVSNEAISEYIDRATNEKLSRQDFRDIRASMRITEIELYNALREELKAKIALRMRLPESPATPEEYWQMYRRMHVNQQLDVAAIPVASFVTSQEPSQAELTAFFEANKLKVPNQEGPGSAGFYQQQRVGFAYLEANYEEVEKQVPPVTDAEVEQYYAEHKEDLYKNKILPDETPAAKENQPITPELTPESKPEETPESKPEGTPEANTPPKTEADPKPQGEARPEEKPAADAPVDAAKPEAEEKPGNSPAPSNDSAAGLSGNLPEGIEFVLFQAAENSADEEAPVEAPIPGAAAPALPDNAKPPEKKPDPLPPYKPLDDFLRSEIREQLLEQRTKEAIDKQLNAALGEMEQIDNDYNAPLDAEQKIKPEAIVARVREIAKAHRLRFVEVESLSAQELSRLGERAAEEQSENATNPDRAPTEKYRKYLVTQATQGNAVDSFRRDAETVIAALFADREGRLYSPFVATEPLSNNRYIVWKTENVKAHVPKLTDAGIREQAIKAWQLEQARQPARKRAEELAAKLSKAAQADETMQSVLAGETVTGKPDGLELTVQRTRSFSWLETSSAAPTNFFMQPPPVIANIPNVEKAGNDFMEVAFEKLREGEAGVAPNADLSIYYVIRVVSRTPSSEGGISALRRAFFNSNVFTNQQFSFLPSTYVTMAREKQQELNYNWSRQLEEQYGVKYPAPTENEE